MKYPQVSFQVRLRSRDGLRQRAERVGQVFGCRFGPTEDPMFSYGEALEAYSLGLQITLSHDPDVPEGEWRTYVLMGHLHGRIEAEWEMDVPRLSISKYIQGVLIIMDDEGWYVPDRKELLDEAGLGEETKPESP